MSDNLVIERDLVKAPAFRSLSGRAILVLMDFYCKRQWQPLKKPYSRKKQWIEKNNGQIEYAYCEAERKGFTRPRFQRALDELIEKGFIDCTYAGSWGVKGDKSKYGLSDRWRFWGTPEFKEVIRPKDTRQGRGFSVWHERKKRANIGNSFVTYTSNRIVT